MDLDRHEWMLYKMERERGLNVALISDHYHINLHLVCHLRNSNRHCYPQHNTRTKAHSLQSGAHRAASSGRKEHQEQEEEKFCASPAPFHPGRKILDTQMMDDAKQRN